MTISAFTRQEAIHFTANPNSSIDYLVQFDCTMVCANRSLSLSIRMVPDRWVMEDACLQNYIALLSASVAPIETLANQILADLLNTLIPRFLHVELCHKQGNQSHRVVMEEKQPKWNNAGLLARLALL